VPPAEYEQAYNQLIYSYKTDNTKTNLSTR